MKQLKLYKKVAQIIKETLPNKNLKEALEILSREEAIQNMLPFLKDQDKLHAFFKEFKPEINTFLLDHFMDENTIDQFFGDEFFSINLFDLEKQWAFITIEVITMAAKRLIKTFSEKPQRIWQLKEKYKYFENIAILPDESPDLGEISDELYEDICTQYNFFGVVIGDENGKITKELWSIREDKLSELDEFIQTNIIN